MDAKSIKSDLLEVLTELTRTFQAESLLVLTPLRLARLQAQLLVYLVHSSPAGRCVDEMATAFQIALPTTSEALRPLMKRRLIRLERTKADGRRRLARLTAKGQQLAEQVEKSLREAVTSGLSVEEEQIFASALRMLMDRWKTSTGPTNRTQHNCTGKAPT